MERFVTKKAKFVTLVKNFVNLEERIVTSEAEFVISEAIFVTPQVGFVTSCNDWCVSVCRFVCVCMCVCHLKKPFASELETHRNEMNVSPVSATLYTFIDVFSSLSQAINSW